MFSIEILITLFVLSVGYDAITKAADPKTKIPDPASAPKNVKFGSIMKYTNVYGIAGNVPNRNNHAPSSSSVFKCLNWWNNACLGGSSKALKKANEPNPKKNPENISNDQVNLKSTAGSKSSWVL